MINIIRLATRKSPLAIWQANNVKNLINKNFPEIKIEIKPMTTKGDQITDRTLTKIGGKGLFIKELEQAILENRADIAVHSLKDVPMQLSQGFTLAGMLMREIPNDALISKKYRSLDHVPDGGIIGTSSLRRQAVIKSKYKNLNINPIRGNINTRLEKLNQGECDAIILAGAGLIRMNLKNRITELLPIDTFIPAVGQGVIAIECLQENIELQKMLTNLSDLNSIICCSAERTFAEILQGSCEVPLAAYAFIDEHRRELHLRAMVADAEGIQAINGTKKIELPILDTTSLANIQEYAIKCGNDLANYFIDKGAKELIEKILADQ